MKATFYEKNLTMRVGEMDVVTPGPKDANIRIHYGGICGTDLHIYRGHMDWRVAESQIMGHEVSGVIEAVGDEVTSLQVGDRVTVMPLQPCNHCPTCDAGYHHICQNLKFMGIDSPGGFQEIWTAPEYTVFKIPQALSLEHAALIEPLAVACHDVRLSGIQQGDTAAILGGGPIGALIAMVAKSMGVNVLVSEISDYRVELLNKMGIETVNPQEADVEALVKEKTQGKGVDAVFEVTGHPSGIELACKLPKARGLIVVVGIFSEPVKVDLFQFFWKELQLRGARVYESEDFARAIELAAGGSLALDNLITHRYPLDAIADALDGIHQGMDAMKVLLTMNDETIKS